MTFQNAHLKKSGRIGSSEGIRCPHPLFPHPGTRSSPGFLPTPEQLCLFALYGFTFLHGIMVHRQLSSFCLAFEKHFFIWAYFHISK